MLVVELLLAGTRIERVSALLGHSPVKITERHYAPWVKERQAQLESDVENAWRDDPIAQKELMLRGDTALQKEGHEPGNDSDVSTTRKGGVG
jgi:hypothetical protein